MSTPFVDSGLERGMVLTTRAQITLRNQLSRQRAWLAHLLRDPSLPGVRLVQADGPPVAFDWRLVLRGAQGALLQLGLPCGVLDRVGAPGALRPLLRDALAAQLMAPVLPALTRFFGEDLALSVEPAGEDGADSAAWVRLHVRVAGIDQALPARLPPAFAQKLAGWLAATPQSGGARVPVSLFAGHCLALPIDTVRGLREGDVLLPDEPASHADARLHIESAGAMRQARYLATLRTDDGCVLHLADACWSIAHARTPRPGRRAQVEVVEARLAADAACCRGLALGQRFDAWDEASWLPEPELRIGGLARAALRRTRVAGRAGFEVLRLQAGGRPPC